MQTGLPFPSPTQLTGALPPESLCRRVIVIDPRGSVSAQLHDLSIPQSAGIEFHSVSSIAGAKQYLFENPSAVGLVVFDSPSKLTPEQVEPLVASISTTEWIAMITPEALADTAFQSFLLAFHDYHSLPLDPQRLLMTIGHACGKAELRNSLDGRRIEQSARFGIYGKSQAMQDFFKRLEKVITADLAVLIGGETGTGKELVARAIHRHSRRADGPFVVVNCGAIPSNLIQAELFGHEKGAFTGATQRKIGSIEAADGGDLFLDEIGDLPLEHQVNLLRVIQERTICRLGSTEMIPVDCRIIAATHINLQEAVRARKFREDLYYRLHVLHLDLPPLRARNGDIPLLAETIFRDYAAGRTNCRAAGFSAQALRAMSEHHWPGNVRELMNRIHRAIILTDNRLISASDLGLNAVNDIDDAKVIPTLENARASFDRTVIENCLRANDNNVSKTARQLGVSRVTLYRMINKHKREATN